MTRIKNKKQTLIQRIKVLEKMVSYLYIKQKQYEEANNNNDNNDTA